MDKKQYVAREWFSNDYEKLSTEEQSVVDNYTAKI